MKYSLVKTALIPAVLCVTFMLGRQAISGPAAPGFNKAKGATNEVTALMTERRDLLRQMERLYLAQYRNGQGSLQDLNRATKEAILADLELPHSRAERIRLRQEWVDRTAEFEKLAEQRLTVGTAMQTEVYEARVAHIDAEIDFAREKSGRAAK